MGGGFMFAAATPPYSAASRNSQTPNSVTANIGDGFLGPVPSRSEVERAILHLQRFMRCKSEDNEGLLELEMLQSPGFKKLCDAFSMMLQEPSLEKLVISISCDESVWEAIMINEAVQDLRASFPFSTGKEEEKLLRYPESRGISVLIMRWIMEFTNSKVLQLLESFLSYVKEIFEPGSNEKPTSELTHHLDDKVRSSFLLSLVILLIVLITRGDG